MGDLYCTTSHLVILKLTVPIAQFLYTTREQREALQVELAILDVDTWRTYSQEGQTRSRRAELTRSWKGEDGKAPSL
jgi:hypothetical protein